MSQTLHYCITGKLIHLFRKFWGHELDRVLLENLSRHACITPRNSEIDDWMSFSVIRSVS